MKFNREEIREKYKDLFEYSLDLIYINDMRGNFLDANDIALKMLGFERDEIPDISFIDLLDQENLMKAIKVTNEIRKTGKQSERSEYKLKTKEGKYIFVETYAIPLKKKERVYAVLGIGNDITERRLSEQKLKESEDIFKALYKEGPIAAYTWKKIVDDFILIDFNIAAENLTHGNVMNVLGHKASEMYRDRLDILEDLHKCYNESTHTTREITYKFQFTEEQKYLLVNYGYVKPDLVIVQTEDMTEKRIAEQKLRESEKKYRSILENMQDGYFEVDLKGNYVFVNDYQCKFLGYQKDELLSMNYRDILDKATINEVFKKFNQLYNDENTRAIFESKVLRSDGKTRIIDGTAYLKFDSRGNKVGFYGFTRDITDKIESEQKLRESEEKYRYLFEDSPFAIILINSKGEIIDCNPATEVIGGYNKSDLQGKKFMDLTIIHPDFLPMLVDLFERFIKGEILHRIDIKLYKKDGGLIWVNLQGSLVELGSETLVQVMLHDITKRKEADLLIKEEIQKLQELDQLRKDLISRVSHELKTPLVSVFSSSELLLNVFKDKLGEEVLDLIQMIQKGGKRLNHLVDNLLDITRIEYDKFKLEKESLNLTSIIKECSEEMRYLIKERKLDLILNLPQNIHIEIDRLRIEQVITNLLLNAIKNTPPKGKITISLSEKDNWAEFSVIDTGIGLTEEEMSIIFTRFGKIERYEEGLEYIDIQGSGLGLFISKEIVDLHGGHIRAESEGRGKGSMFVVKLPIK